ncbi:hypothetical protein MBLNU457_5310t1 [Dothideomycetes sp. NU457]
MSFTPDATPVAPESISTSSLSPVVVPEPACSSSSSREAIQLLPQNAPATRQRRDSITSYFRRFRAVVTRKRSDLGKDSLTEVPAGHSTTENNHKHVISPPTLPGASHKDVVRPSVSRQNPPTSTSVSSLKKRFSTYSGNSSIITKSRQAAQDERASFLFARYGLGNTPRTSSIASSGTNAVVESQTALVETQPPPCESPPLLRVQRKARLRMHTTCHECSTIFAHGSKYCSNCNHERCRDCPRAPPKGVTNLVAQTKQDLATTTESTPTETTMRAMPRSPLVSRLQVSRRLHPHQLSDQSLFTTGSLQLLLLPDSPPPSDREGSPQPTFDDLLKLCAFAPTRKRALKASSPAVDKSTTSCLEKDCLERQKSLEADESEHEVRAARPVHGPRERVYRKVRLRRRKDCAACGRQHSATAELCDRCKQLTIEEPSRAVQIVH